MKRLILSTLLLAFIAGLVCWTLHVPYAPERLYQVIPQGAVLISSHTDVAGRWEEIVHNPISLSLLSSLGMDVTELDELSRDEEFRTWLERLASDEVVVAYVPRLGMVGGEVWVFTAWIGGWSQRLRWGLEAGGADGVEEIARHNGRIIWAAEQKEGARERVYFSLTEGVMIGCVADHPSAMTYLLDVYDGRIHGAHSAVLEQARRGFCGDAASEDSGWYTPSLRRLDDAWSYSLTHIETNAVTGSACCALTLDEDASWRTSLDADGLSLVLGDHPLAVTLLSPDALQVLLNEWAGEPWRGIVNDLSSGLHAKASAISVLGGEYSGRIKGLKWPALVIALQLDESADADVVINRALDNLNARHRWGLVPQTITVGAQSITVLQGTSGSFYSKLALNERFAYGRCGNWLLFSSNTQTLRKLVEYYQSTLSVGQVPAARWQACLSREEGIVGAAWMDVVAGGKAVRLALTAYSMKLMFEDAEKSQSQRQSINEAKAWVDALAPLETLTLRLKARDKRSRFDFELGSLDEDS